MTERAKTVRELLASMEKHAVAAHKEVTKDEPEAAARNDGFWMGVAMAHSKLDPILDALIGCQGRVVYTAEDVERCEEAISGGLTHVKMVGGPVEFNSAVNIRGIARAAITAAGGVVADEVVEVGHYLSIPLADGSVHADPGDILYIVRAKEE